MRTLASLASPISSLVVSPDGSTVVTASDEGIGFLDLTSGMRLVTSLEEEVSRLTFGPDGLLAGTLSGEVWSIGRAPVRLFEAIDDEISGIAATSDGTIAVCGGEPFAVATFGPHGNEEWRGEPYKWPYCVRFSSDGNLLLVATWDGNLFVFDAHDLPDELASLDGEYAGGPIFDARFLSGERVLVVGASFVRIWDRGTRAYVSNCELPAEALACAVSPDGGCTVVSTNDQRLRLFSLPDLAELGDLGAGPRGAKELSFFPDYAEFCHVKGPATIRTLAFHPDGTRVFGSTEDHRIVEITRAELQRVARPTRLPAARSPDASASPPAQLSLALPPPPVASPPARASVKARAATAPAAKAPAAKAPAAKARAATAPAAKAPAAQAHAAKAHATKAPAAKATTTKATAAIATAAKAPAAKALAAKAPAARVLAAKAPAAKAPAAKAPAARATAARATAAKAPAAKAPAARATAAKALAAKAPAARATDGAAKRRMAPRRIVRGTGETAARPTARRANGAPNRLTTQRTAGMATGGSSVQKGSLPTAGSSVRRSSSPTTNGALARAVARKPARSPAAIKSNPKLQAGGRPKPGPPAKASKPASKVATRPRSR